MASRNPIETLNPAKRIRLEAESGLEDANEEDETLLEELEREVKEMAQKIVDFRSSIPERLGEVVSSASLALLRPKLHTALGSVASDPTGSECTSHPVNDAGEREFQKLNVFKEKVMNNIAAAPAILKRLNGCLARINQLKQYNVNIHPAFEMRKKQ